MNNSDYQREKEKKEEEKEKKRKQTVSPFVFPRKRRQWLPLRESAINPCKRNVKALEKWQGEEASRQSPADDIPP